MATAAGFNMWHGLLGLLPIVVYVILIFTYKDPVPITAFCVVLGALITHQTVFSFANALVKSMGSFLALIGLIIMMGRGLGEVLTATRVTHTLVHKIIYGIGVNTENRAMLGIMTATIVIVGLLGTMAGGNAIIAPIVLPVAAAAGLTKSTVGVLFQACGEEGLILGPFTPPVVTLIGLTHVPYLEMLLKCAIPVSVVTLGVTWLMAHKIQKWTKGINDYEKRENTAQFVPTPQQMRTTMIFAVSFALFVGYGLYWRANTNFIVVVMMGLALITGLAGGLGVKSTFEIFIKGMAGNLNFFLLFLLLEPFMQFMEQAGAFKTVAILLQPLVNYGGKVAVPIMGGLTGAVGLTGATVAVMKMTNDMFLPLVRQHGITMVVWTTALIVATRATNFFHPGSNMFSSMGFAESKDMASMVKNGWTVAFCQLAFLCVYAYLMV